MNSFQSTSDKASIALSLLCACHCLFLPFLLLLFPTLVALPMGDEAFHVWMLAAVVPFSLFALYRGYKVHNTKVIPLVGLFGLLILVFTAVFGHDLFSETFEKVFTLIGALIVAGSHLANYRKCQCKDSVVCSTD
ncbi:MerC domain-containing protein [Parashewanella tropica]|uniref:MerC domain-containing protein n=1 Tax=Parashewanella tropica TaxID=2547970 RepID=UPI0010599923|nr:MerC domain-containing protein [Parashewanella tropica]